MVEVSVARKLTPPFFGTEHCRRDFCLKGALPVLIDVPLKHPTASDLTASLAQCVQRIVQSGEPSMFFSRGTASDNGCPPSRVDTPITAFGGEVKMTFLLFSSLIFSHLLLLLSFHYIIFFLVFLHFSGCSFLFFSILFNSCGLTP